MTAASQKLPSSCQLLHSTSVRFLNAAPAVLELSSRGKQHLCPFHPAHVWLLSHPSTPKAFLRILLTLGFLNLLLIVSTMECNPTCLHSTPQSSMPKQYSAQLLLINSEVAMGKISMLTRSPTCPRHCHERQGRTVCWGGW